VSIKPKDLTAIRMSSDLVEALKHISAQPGGFYSERSVNWLISQAVKEFIERQLPKPEVKP
jgi:predicted transcriptional regulator